jgi:isoquinoline 1-oxidoreductase beta subunit
VECFIDELAHAAGQDPYLFRKRLLQMPDVNRTDTSAEGTPPDRNRLVAVLDLAAEKSEWQKPLGPHRGRGIACTTNYAYLAQVAEVTVERDNIRVDRLVTAADCGQVVNPNGARAQLEGGMLFTLSSILKERQLRFATEEPNSRISMITACCACLRPLESWRHGSSRVTQIRTAWVKRPWG